MSSTHLPLHYHVIYSTNPNISHRGGESACSSREKLRCSPGTGCSNLFPSRRLAFPSKPVASSPPRCEMFGLSASQREQVRDYIARQEEHHKKRTFQEEYVEFLELCRVDYDRRYLW